MRENTCTLFAFVVLAHEYGEKGGSAGIFKLVAGVFAIIHRQVNAIKVSLNERLVGVACSAFEPTMACVLRLY